MWNCSSISLKSQSSTTCDQSWSDILWPLSTAMRRFSLSTESAISSVGQETQIGNVDMLKPYKIYGPKVNRYVLSDWWQFKHTVWFVYQDLYLQYQHSNGCCYVPLRKWIGIHRKRGRRQNMAVVVVVVVIREVTHSFTLWLIFFFFSNLLCFQGNSHVTHYKTVLQLSGAYSWAWLRPLPQATLEPHPPLMW